MGMSKAFRLGYKLGRLHGKVQYAEQTTQVWNGYVENLNSANTSAAQSLDELHTEAVSGLDMALQEAGVTINDLDEANLTPASRKDRRKLREAKRRWKSDFDPLP